MKFLKNSRVTKESRRASVAARGNAKIYTGQCFHREVPRGGSCGIVISVSWRVVGSQNFGQIAQTFKDETICPRLPEWNAIPATSFDPERDGTITRELKGEGEERKRERERKRDRQTDEQRQQRLYIGAHSRKVVDLARVLLTRCTSILSAWLHKLISIPASAETQLVEQIDPGARSRIFERHLCRRGKTEEKPRAPAIVEQQLSELTSIVSRERELSGKEQNCPARWRTVFTFFKPVDRSRSTWLKVRKRS